MYIITKKNEVVGQHMDRLTLEKNMTLGTKLWRLVKDNSTDIKIDWNFNTNLFMSNKDIRIHNDVFNKDTAYIIPGDWKGLFNIFKKSAKVNVIGSPKIEGECLDGLLD